MASAILTINQVKEAGLGAGLSDASLQIVIDAMDTYMQDKAGPHIVSDSTTTTINTDSYNLDYYNRVTIPRGVRTTVGLLVQVWDGSSYVDVDYTLENMYKIFIHGLVATPNPVSIKITYKPVQDVELRRQVLLNLIRHQLMYPGTVSMSAAGLSYNWDYTQAYQLLKPLIPTRF